MTDSRVGLYPRGILVTGVTGAGAMLDSVAPRHTVNPYLRLRVLYGFTTVQYGPSSFFFVFYIVLLRQPPLVS